jgi:hypothetical protein
MVAKGQTYHRAELNCQANGMDLFDVSSEEFETDLFDYAAEIFGEYTGAFLNVKSQKDGECQYISNYYGPFHAYYGYCLEKFYSFCGFKNPNPSEPNILANGEGEFLTRFPKN